MKISRKPGLVQAPPVGDKDQKILWARGAGRCAKCREELTFDPADGNAATLGEMCHIVGEKMTSPRGASPMPLKERSKYSNLILLCGLHHTEVDKDARRYAVEVLHEMKDQHEQWVRESLGSREANPDDLVYSDLIDTITMALQLDNWYWFVDNAARDLVPIAVADAHGYLNRKLLGTIWPKKKPRLRRSIIRVLDAFDQFMTHYLTNVEPRAGDTFFGPDRSFARFGAPDFYEHEKKEERWSRVNFWLLSRLSIRLNEYASAVRALSNPLYFRLHGKFLVHDSMGFHFGGENKLFSPRLNHVNDQLKRLSYKRQG